jgi:hypothetical protein
LAHMDRRDFVVAGGTDWGWSGLSPRGVPFVVMVETADFRDLHDPAGSKWLGRSRDRRVLFQGEVRAPGVVVVKISSEVAPQRLLVPDDDVVEAFAANRADHALHEGVGVSCRLHRQRAVSHQRFVLPMPSILSVAGRFS